MKRTSRLLIVLLVFLIERYLALDWSIRMPCARRSGCRTTSWRPRSTMIIACSTVRDALHPR